MYKHNAYALLLFCLTLLMTACGSSTSETGTNVPDPNSNTVAHSAIGSFNEFPLPRTGSGLMRPALDSQGNLWFGEMNHNYLTMFDTHTLTFDEIIPPQGKYGVMGVTAAPDDTIWFAEQEANYIGHYFPATKRFVTYALPSLHIPAPNSPENSGSPGNTHNTTTLPSGPNDVALDRQGNLWFTEINADSIAMLDTHSGAIHQYQLTRPATVQKLNPYGIAVDNQNNIWFTESSNNLVGRLDPKSGKIHLYPISNPSVQLMEIACAPNGLVWITSFNDNELLRLDPTTGIFKGYDAPSTSAGSGGLYGLTITPGGAIWVTVPAENAIARFLPETHSFQYHVIPTANSSPLGLALNTRGQLWFTEVGSDTIGEYFAN